MRDKAILVINMPENCGECSLNNFHFCSVTTDEIEEYLNSEERPYWCPLQPVPEKYDLCDSYYDYELGYNRCIDEILKTKRQY